MARASFGEAWLTSAVDDDCVISALVLAESLRRTKTTRRIGVIVGDNVSKDKRMVLRKAFDALFLMDESLVPTGHLGESERAKIYAFSLQLFQKCIFVSPNTLVLENADKLFEGEKAFKALKTDGKDSIDMSIFMFTPCLDLCEYLSKTANQNGKTISERYLRQWIEKTHGTNKMTYIPGKYVLKFSVKNGNLLKDRTHAPIIQFVDAHKEYEFESQLSSLALLELGLSEKVILETWLQMFHQNVASALKDPQSAPIKSGFEPEMIAIVGMSCRYPGANNVEEFWKLLFQGDEGIREVPAFRWTKEHSIRVSQLERKTNAGFLSTTVDEFDARFFGVSPKEAAFMDPQARILHEVLWESLEDAGIDPLSLYGTHTGIFTGSWMNDYKDIVSESTEKDFFRTYMGNSIGAAAARLSFLLGLTGPSIATESGCSSSIVAVDLAVKSLRNNESNLALAGGVNLLLHPFTSNIMDYVIAPNGRCKTFDAKADGFGRAEGCGVLVLKRLSDALRDRDNIWGMIRGSGMTQEGISKSMGTPTVQCESLAMTLALKDANVRPEQVSYVETHGTGTAVGDPMEVSAIAKAYHSDQRKDPLVIGSVKTNVGHTESCSGITGIMKAILCMQHELIPKHRNLETLNPEIKLESIPATIPLEHVPWPKTDIPRMAGVSSFGITGTDGHVIIQEPPLYELPKFSLGLERPVHIMKISAKSGEALDDLLKSYEQMFVERVKESNFANAAYTANTGRATFNHRAFIVASNYEDAKKVIQSPQCLRGDVKEEPGQICFLFTGQGSQYSGMAKQLYETSPVFRVSFDACDRTLRETYNLSIRQVLWESTEDPKQLSRTIYSQTSIFCIEYCLLKLWKSWGITPDYVLGHSLGEFAAAVAAGILKFKDALKLVAERSRLIDNLPRGSMLVIKGGKSEIERHLRSSKIQLDFAAVNSPDQTVVAGDTETIMNFSEYCKAKGLKTLVLEATHAFHSCQMDPMLEQYRKVAETIKFKKAKCSYVSGMDGRIIEPQEIDANYWVRHTREKVSFVDACTALREADCNVFLEVGPQPVLSSFVMLNNEDQQLSCFPSLRRGSSDWETILNTLGKLFLLGYKVNWKGFDDPYKRNKVSLPFHPYHRKSYWVEVTAPSALLIHPLLGHSLSNASALNIFQNDLNLKSVAYMRDHCIGNRIVFAMAAFGEMCLTAGYAVANGLTDSLDILRRPVKIENFRIDAPLELKEGKSCRLQTIVDLPDESQEDGGHGGFRVKIFHQNTSEESSGKWVLHASTTFSPVSSNADIYKNWNPDRMKELMSTTEEISTDAFYKRIDETGLKFGPLFRSLVRHWSVKDSDATDELVAEVIVPEDFQKYLLHPVLVDAMIQATILTKYRYENSKLKVPISIGKLTLFTSDITFPQNKEDGEEGSNVLLINAWTFEQKAYVYISTSDFIPVACMEGIELVDTNVKTIESVLEQQTSSLPDLWEEIWKPIPGPMNNRVSPIKLEKVFGDLEVQRILEGATAISASDEKNAIQVDKLLYLYILNALYNLGWKPAIKNAFAIEEFCDKYQVLPLHKKLMHYFFTVFEEEGFSKYVSNTKTWEIVTLPPPQCQVQQEIKAIYTALKGVEGSESFDIYHHLSNCLPDILKGGESALTTLFPTEESKEKFSANFYYQNHPARPYMIIKTVTILQDLWKKLRSANTHQGTIRVLEVGSGTGSMSLKALELLKETWGDRFEYYFTDISSSFFIKAEKTLEEHKGQIKFNVFNIEESPLAQGIPLNYFDCVLGTDVIHATRHLQECLGHLRQIMKPGGSLLFTETLKCRDLTFVFGLLEGYWRYEDNDIRPHHCCMSEDGWKNVLERSGFTSVHTSNTYLGRLFCIVGEAVDQATKVNFVRPVENQKKWVILSPGENDVTSIKVAQTLESTGNKVVMVVRSTDKVTSSDFSVVKIQAEREDPSKMESVLKDEAVEGIVFAWGMDINEQDQRRIALPFLHIAKFLLGQKKPPRLYVVTQGVHPVAESLTCNPSAATLFGMLKSLKNENSDLYARYLDLDFESGADEKCEQIMYEIAMKDSREAARVQIAYRNALRYEPKFVKAKLSTSNDELQLPTCTDRYHLTLPKSRAINDLEFEALDQLPVGECEIEVKVAAYALNFKDILTILKPNPEFEKLNTVGLDFAGVVTKVGQGVSPEKLKVGDRVFGCNFKEGALPSHIITDVLGVLTIPNHVTYWEAATLPAVVCTSVYCLVNVAKIKSTDTVLIHTGSGGVGLSAIQLAKHVGANIITTAGSPRKRAYLRSLGLKYVFHSRDPSYEKEIMKATNGRGVDIVLNSITGPGLKEASLNACAKNARFVEMSKLAIWTPEEVKAQRPDVDYTIVDLTYLDREVWVELLSRMQQFLLNGALQPIPYVKFDALNIRQALQYFQKAKHIGKVVCTMPEFKKVDGVVKVDSPMFNNESTYLITGGLGGIGFEVAKWMLEKGATDIVLTGRNPPKREIAEKIQELNNKKGCNIMIKYADVGNQGQCGSLITDITQNCKTLRGVFHAAGVLRDNMYINQNWQSFSATYNAKVVGSWNLHNLTREFPLEHFIFFSSVTALMGTIGQGNHSSANTFEDALAQYRHSMGLPATTINWGQFAEVGVAKEISLSGVLPVSVKRMFNGLEAILKAQRLQTCVCDFESFHAWSLICPIFKHYVDDRLWKQYGATSQEAQGFKSEQFWQEMDQCDDKNGKIQVISVYLKRILRSALRLEADEPINADSNIQDLGVDSLMMIELKNSIQTLLGSKVIVTASLLKNCTTVSELAIAIVNKISGEDELETTNLSPEELTNLLKSDCLLPEHIKSPSSEPVVKASEIKTVFVTGTSGQLGPYILRELTQNYKSVKRIICLIRPKPNITPDERLRKQLESMNLSNVVDMKIIECIEGDVARPCFGIEAELYEQLCDSVDAIIHCAVKGNHVEAYRKYDNGVSDIRSANVGGTLHVLEFASAKKTKQVYFASAYTSIFGANDCNTLNDNWPELSEISTIVQYRIPGYQTSKYIVEMLMKEANQRGIPCKVFRFPWITGDSKTGQLNYVNNHYILRFLSYLKVKAMPSVPVPAIVLSVDTCAELSMKLFMNDEAPFEIYNVGHPDPQLEQEFVNIAKDCFGIDMGLIEYKDFAEKLQVETPLESLKELYTDVERVMSILTSDAIQSVKGWLQSPVGFFTNNKVEKFIPNFANGIPSTMDIIKKDLQYAKSKGFFQQLGI